MRSPHDGPEMVGSFPTEADLAEWCRRACGGGPRGTGSPAHEAVLDWLTEQLASIPGLELRSEEFTVHGWSPPPGLGLEGAGALDLDGERLPVAGAVPYSRPTSARGALVHLPAGTEITADNAGGRVVLRDFPHLPIPYGALRSSALHASDDLAAMDDEIWDRPGLADGILHDDLLAAGRAGAAGLVIGFDVPRRQVAGYHEPHKGTHYAVPAVFVGEEERRRLRSARDAVVGLRVDATTGPATTRNLHATLPGRSGERAVLVTHTDGNTWVQENGVAGLLALATHFAQLPVDERARTIEFAFTSAHLHISREGSARYAAALDRSYDDGRVAFVFALEHLGVREVAPTPCEDAPGRALRYTGDPELVLWSVGPSPAVRRAVIGAVAAHDLPRTLVVGGLGERVRGRVPEIESFGGLGTHYHSHLLPTTGVLTAPWTLWAPSFGSDAVDLQLMRRQLQAAATVIRSLDGASRTEIAGQYVADRAARAAGAPTVSTAAPPELAPELSS